MKKIYLSLLAVIVCVFCFNTLNAQRKVGDNIAVPKISKLSSGTGFSPLGTTADCDTINLPTPAGWTLIYYTVTGGGGYVAGTNKYADKQKAQYFDLSATANTFITGASFYFFKANSTAAANLTKTVSFKVYEDNAGSPGNQLGTAVAVPLSKIKADVAANNTTDIIFPAPLPYLHQRNSMFQWTSAISFGM